MTLVSEESRTPHLALGSGSSPKGLIEKGLSKFDEASNPHIVSCGSLCYPGGPGKTAKLDVFLAWLLSRQLHWHALKAITKQFPLCLWQNTLFHYRAVRFYLHFLCFAWLWPQTLTWILPCFSQINDQTLENWLKWHDIFYSTNLCSKFCTILKSKPHHLLVLLFF